jgi:hypothetical protein
MRSFGQLVLIGVAGFIGLKILGGVTLPILGMLLGLLTMLIKVALVVAVVYFILNLLKDRKREKD